jgi:hypothetical protein
LVLPKPASHVGACVGTTLGAVVVGATLGTSVVGLEDG